MLTKPIHEKVCGTITWFDADMGVGCIALPAFEAPVFVHHQHILHDADPPLTGGESVRLNLHLGEECYYATQVMRTSIPPDMKTLQLPHDAQIVGQVLREVFSASEQQLLAAMLDARHRA